PPIQTTVEPGPGDALRELSEVLWREREQLELVLFKLEEQRLLLVDGQSRWVGHASREVEFVLDQVGQMELTRALATAVAAAGLGLVGDVGLRAIACVAPSPWPSVIERHLAALGRLAEEVLVLAAVNRGLLGEALGQLRSVMSSDPARASTRVLVDAAAYQAALATNDRVLHPSLVDAVRR
ncbi:MAG: flagellar export chaperone FlgN, partial [Acidimicrobiia bacterium]